MHSPDGFFDATTHVAAAAVAVGALGLAARRSRAELRSTPLALAAVATSVVFAAQMLNFPIASGTSGHLLGAALLAILIGPASAMLAMTLILVVQALLFADGGLLALGVNAVTMAVVAPLLGYAVFRLGRAALPGSKRFLALSAFAAGVVSVVAAALAFGAAFALGGAMPIDPWTVLLAMGEVHLLIGAVEGVVTALVVSAVASVRPDLVHGVRAVAPRQRVAEPAPVPA